MGSHVVLRKEGSKVTLTVPKHKELKPGLLRNLIKASGLMVEEFEALLNRLSQNSNHFYNWIMSNVDFKFRS